MGVFIFGIATMYHLPPFCQRSCLQMGLKIRNAAAVASGILACRRGRLPATRKNAGKVCCSRIIGRVQNGVRFFPPGWKHGSTSAKDGRRYIFRPGLKSCLQLTDEPSALRDYFSSPFTSASFTMTGSPDFAVNFVFLNSTPLAFRISRPAPAASIWTFSRRTFSK